MFEGLVSAFLYFFNEKRAGLLLLLFLFCGCCCLLLFFPVSATSGDYNVHLSNTVFLQTESVEIRIYFLRKQLGVYPLNNLSDCSGASPQAISLAPLGLCTRVIM